MKVAGKALAVVILTLIIFPGFVLADEESGEGDAQLGGLAAFGVGLIFTGTAYYALTKRRLFIEHRKGEPGIVVRPERPYVTVFGPVYPMTIHHAFTVVGTLLALAHFATCTDYSTIGGKAGLGMAITLILLNISGFYGRYVHIKIEKAARKKESRALKHFVGIMRRWKVLHVVLVAVFLLLLGIHLATVGD
ncbi:hypothetical protein [Thermococcus sp.]|uniref:hypothetical protein n=1 Tax=Thermococcus sp. TaxID=35749 RepID=UPI002615933C|nr:hypothetical protein [Thermococcus sp.]